MPAVTPSLLENKMNDVFYPFREISPLKIVTLPRELLSAPGFPPPAKHKILAIFCGLNEFMGTETQLLKEFLSYSRWQGVLKFMTYNNTFELQTIMCSILLNRIHLDPDDDYFYTRMRNPIILLELFHNQPYTPLKDLCKLLNMDDIIYSPPTSFDADPTEALEVGRKNNIVFNKICSQVLPR